MIFRVIDTKELDFIEKLVDNCSKCPTLLERVCEHAKIADGQIEIVGDETQVLLCYMKRRSRERLRSLQEMDRRQSQRYPYTHHDFGNGNSYTE
ncbi:MAG: hypothetical protein ABIJ18_03945 [archaeon]